LGEYSIEHLQKRAQKLKAHLAKREAKKKRRAEKRAQFFAAKTKEDRASRKARAASERELERSSFGWEDVDDGGDFTSGDDRCDEAPSKCDACGYYDESVPNEDITHCPACKAIDVCDKITPKKKPTQDADEETWQYPCHVCAKWMLKVGRGNYVSPLPLP
jgi:hypothetical protein